MTWLPPGYGGVRRSPEDIKREGWVEQGLLAVSVEDHLFVKQTFLKGFEVALHFSGFAADPSLVSDNNPR